MMPLAPQMTTLDAAIIITLAAVCFILFLMSLYLFKELQFLRAFIAGIEQEQEHQWDHINSLEKEAMERKNKERRDRLAGPQIPPPQTPGPVTVICREPENKAPKCSICGNPGDLLSVLCDGRILGICDHCRKALEDPKIQEALHKG